MKCVKIAGNRGYIRTDSIVAILENGASQSYVTVQGRTEGDRDGFSSDYKVDMPADDLRRILEWDVVTA